MSQPFDVHDLASRNPQIDLEQIREVQRAVAQLRKAGFRRRGYRLLNPFQRPPPETAEEADARTSRHPGPRRGPRLLGPFEGPRRAR